MCVAVGGEEGEEPLDVLALLPAEEGVESEGPALLTPPPQPRRSEASSAAGSR